MTDILSQHRTERMIALALLVAFAAVLFGLRTMVMDVEGAESDAVTVTGP